MKYKGKENLFFSIIMPVYNGARVISPTVKSILSQSYKNFELIIVDDKSKDNTISVIKSFKDKRISVHENKINLGYSGNLEECRKKATGDIIYLMGQDDILAKDALLNTYHAFNLSEDVGAVTRPYFWFDTDIKTPVRAKQQMDSSNDTVIRISDDPVKVRQVFDTLDQLSGLAYRKKFIDMPFHKDVFTCHIYPFASILKKHPIVFLKDYTVAVRISSSQTRKLSSIYTKSPMLSWVEMIKKIFDGVKFEKIQKYLIENFVGMNFVGSLQIRNYGSFLYFLRESYYLVKFRKKNLLNLQFWMIVYMCLFIPPFLLTKIVDWYKSKILSRQFKNLKFTPSL